MKYWLIEFPTLQYNEDVKELARQNDLSIIDLKHRDLINPSDIAQEVPKLTKKKAAKKDIDK